MLCPNFTSKAKCCCTGCLSAPSVKYSILWEDFPLPILLESHPFWYQVNWKFVSEALFRNRSQIDEFSYKNYKKSTVQNRESTYPKWEDTLLPRTSELGKSHWETTRHWASTLERGEEEHSVPSKKCMWYKVSFPLPLTRENSKLFCKLIDALKYFRDKKNFLLVY